MQLQARRQRASNSTRETRRVQRGGAPWAALTSPSISKNYKMLVGKFPFLAQMLNDKAAENDRVNAWITALEQQDTIFGSALDLYKQSTAFEMKDDFSNNTLLNNTATRKAYNNLIVSICYLLQFQFPAADTANPGTGQFVLDNDTKLGAVLKTNDLIKISFFPRTVTNTLVHTIAGVLHALATGTVTIGSTNLNMEAILSYAARDGYISKLLSEQFTGVMYANAYTLTVGPPVESFYVDQSLDEANQILNGAASGDNPFFTVVIEELARLCSQKVQPEKLFIDSANIQEGCPKYCAKLRWPILVAHIARYYMINKSLDTLFSVFGTCTTGDSTTKAYVPDSVAEPPRSDPVTLDGVPILNILRSLGRERFVFLVHLRGVLRELEQNLSVQDTLTHLFSRVTALPEAERIVALKKLNEAVPAPPSSP
jgi:hypothetical protein